jgi:NAD(P)-dependent dehydrogenase (short-subunit alcohol dehydrogenase family)
MRMSAFRLEGQVALVTGAGSGIGRAVAVQLAADGASVVAVDAFEEFSGLTTAGPGLVETRQVDVRKSEEVAELISFITERFGRLDTLCNVAGVVQRNSPLCDVSDEEYDRVLDTNVRGPFLMMKHAIPLLARSGGGSVVNVASIGGLVGRLGGSIYAASKGALIQMTKSAAIEYAREGVRINCVCPGPTKTGITEGVLRAPPEVFEAVTRALPLARFAEPDEIASVVAFLASDASSFVCGSVVVCDGGLIAGMPGQTPGDFVAGLERDAS